MKNLKLLLVLLLTLTLGIYGCKKDDGDPEPEGNGGLVITTPDGKSCLMSKIKSISYNEGEVYEYDSQNRPVKISFFDGTTPDGYVTIDWSSSQVVVKEYTSTGQLDDTQVYTASNGVVTGSTSTDTWTDNGVTYKEVGQETYEHNAEGFITKRTYVETITTVPASTTETSTSTTVYTYQNGNLISEVETDGNDTYTIAYEYYTDKANTLAPEDEGLLLTRANKNPLKKSVETNSAGDSYTTSYTYTYNGDGLITGKVEVEVSSHPGSTPNTEEQIFEYSCK